MKETADNFSENYMFKNYHLQYRNMNEFRWGGPLYGDLYINHRKLEGYFGGPPLFAKDKELIILPRFHETLPNTGCFKLIFWKVPPGFTIAVLDLKNKKMYDTRMILLAVLVTEYNNNIITYYEANHDKFPDTKKEMPFDMNNFELANSFFSYM